MKKKQSRMMKMHARDTRITNENGKITTRCDQYLGPRMSEWRSDGVCVCVCAAHIQLFYPKTKRIKRLLRKINDAEENIERKKTDRHSKTNTHTHTMLAYSDESKGKEQRTPA